MQTMDPTYAQAAYTDHAKMSVDDKFSFLIHEMGTVKQLTLQVQQQQGWKSRLSEITESIQTEIIQISLTTSQQQHRIIDPEARSRRNDLLC